jgi:hypothetical protein
MYDIINLKYTIKYTIINSGGYIYICLMGFFMDMEVYIMEKVTNINNAVQSYAPTQNDPTSSKSTSVTNEQATIADSPAAEVEISVNGLNALSANRRYSVQDTIDATQGTVYRILQRTKELYENYDRIGYDDMRIHGKDLKQKVNSIWEDPSSKTYEDYEWGQHGTTINGKRIVTKGSSDLQQSMTRFFNDLTFESKDDFYRSAAIIEDAYNKMREEYKKG